MTRTNPSPSAIAIPRRQLLTLSGSAAAVWGLAQLLSARTSHAQPATAAPKAVAKSLVVLWLNGGPSHIDTFDPKSGGAFAGPFKAINTRTPAVKISQHLPLLAARSDKFALLRGMTSKEGNHQRARYLGHTGYAPNPTVKYPSLGAWISSDRAQKAALPSFISIGGPAEGGGFLGVEHGPFVMRRAGQLPQNVGYGFDVDADRFQRRMRGLDYMDQRFQQRTGDRSVAARRSVFHSAARLMTAAEVSAFDLSDEPQAKKDDYGDSDFGRGCLVARRLVEAAVPVVEVTLDGWDTHRDNFERVKQRSAILDRAMSALLDDLSQRKRLRDTLVLCMGEFGRTPNINGNDGRDHHPRAFSAVLAGGGIKGGTVYGATDERGAEVIDKPTVQADLFATIVRQLGIEADKVAMSPAGRPIAVTNRGKVITELIA